MGAETRHCFVQVERVELGASRAEVLGVDHTEVFLVLVPIQV